MHIYSNFQMPNLIWLLKQSCEWIFSSCVLQKSLAHIFRSKLWCDIELLILLGYIVSILCRIERLWRDVFIGVTSVYYNILHTLEDNHVLDISNSLHLFCCHYVFLPRIQASLDVFREGWDNPIRTEHNLTPNQLWQVGQFQNPILEPEVDLTST